MFKSDIDINDDGLCSICEGIINISNDLRDKSFFVLSETGKLKCHSIDLYRLSIMKKQKY